MIQQQDEAFVLHTQDLAEADVIVNLFAAGHGKVRGVARAARKSRRRFGGALEPLTRVRARWSEKDGRDLHRIDALESVRSYAPMQADPALQAACAYFAEICETFTHAGQADETGFRLLTAVLDSLESGAEVWGIVRYFEFWTLRLHGVLPALDHCAACHEPLSPQVAARLVGGGDLACRECAPRYGGDSRRITPEVRRYLTALQRSKPDALPDDLRAAAPGGSVEALLRGTLESFSEKRFRAYRHLRAAAVPGDRP